MLETFTCATFDPHVGQTFRVYVESSPPVNVVLIEATELPMSSAPRPRAPFSLVFRGPHTAVLAQGTYAVEHARIGTFDLFLVPIGPDGEGMRYEAVFT